MIAAPSFTEAFLTAQQMAHTTGNPREMPELDELNVPKDEREPMITGAYYRW